MPDRFNVLLITTDTSRCDTLGVYGNPHALSPNLDRLASEGVVFDQAHTPAPVCMPARCSLLTGVHTPVHGCIENGVGGRDDLTLLPDLLVEAGYRNIADVAGRATGRGVAAAAHDGRRAGGGARGGVHAPAAGDGCGGAAK